MSSNLPAKNRVVWKMQVSSLLLKCSLHLFTWCELLHFLQLLMIVVLGAEHLRDVAQSLQCVIGRINTVVR